jgi:hypothetical protein
MVSQRVSALDRDEALAVCAKIKARHPDILERGPGGLYRNLLAGEDMRQALFDYLACDRVASAWARKRPAKDALSLFLDHRQQRLAVEPAFVLVVAHKAAQLRRRRRWSRAVGSGGYVATCRWAVTNEPKARRISHRQASNYQNGLRFSGRCSRLELIRLTRPLDG